MAKELCYFAHHITDYGTAREAAALKVIAKHGFDVENPNSPKHAAAYRERGMGHFTEVVEGCDALAFERFPDGAIGAGVSKEIGAAAVRGLPIFEVLDGEFAWLPDTGEIEGSVLTVDETRAKIAEIRAQQKAETLTD